MGTGREHYESITDAPESLSARQRVRRGRYLWMMGVCVALFVLSWTVVRFVSTPLAIAMAVVASLLPPIAAIVANRDQGV